MSKNKAQTLFKKYKLHNDEEAFIELYNLLEPLLKKIITDVTFIYKGTPIEKQKYYKIYKIEKRISKKISMAKLMERYKDEYIKTVYSEGYDRYKSPQYNLIYPFWELLNKLSLKKVNEDMQKWNVSFEWYLATKFCDMYWSYIEKYLRRDFGKRKGYNKHQMYYNNSLEKNIENNGDYFFNSNGIYDKTFNIQIIIKEFRCVLTRREQQVYDLLFEGYSNDEISELLGVSKSNVYKLKSLIKQKILKWIYD